MASGYEKADCGVDPNFGWNGDPSKPIPMKERLIEASLYLYIILIGGSLAYAKAMWIWEGLKWVGKSLTTN